MQEPVTPPPDDQRTQWLLRYEAWLKLLARLIDSRFQGKVSASDAVQQTLLEAWRCWDDFRGDHEPARLAWLRQILAHQLAHLARHYGATQKRDVARERSIDQTLAQSAQRLERLAQPGQATPSVVAVRREQQVRLAAALERLPDDYRQVIVLRNLEELSHDEIAERLGRTAGAVRMLWLRALAALREQLAESGETL
jgi:RNA polymerase sigma-70 factor (ECF subfamily)